MIKLCEYWEPANKVLENEKAVVAYYERSGQYVAIEKKVSGHEYTKSGLYHRSTRGDFKTAKKAFEKYSGIS